ncbi:MAG: hydroxymethylglutaryl-CoA synthase family protein, partial [Candidatus Sifarchaeia archaeon]
GVDQSKPIASFVQGLLGIGPRTRVYEIKHACYGGTAGIMNAIDWVRSDYCAGKNALVVATDIAKYGLNTSGEPTQGAGSVAFIVSDQAELIHFSPTLNALYSEDVFDFWRPNGHTVPIVDGKYSIECYLKALEFCTNDLRRNIEQKTGKSLLDYFDYFIYHLPFARMAHKAHYRLISSLDLKVAETEVERIFEESFEKKVVPTLRGAREVGNIYTGSVFMSLISLMEEKGGDLKGRNVGIFSYGSGCGSEFFPIRIGDGIRQQVNRINFVEQLRKRRKISFHEYTELYSESGRKGVINSKDILRNKSEFSRYFFLGVEDHRRIYTRA